MGIVQPSLASSMPSSVPPVSVMMPTYSIGVSMVPPVQPQYTAPASSAAKTVEQPPPTTEDNTISAQENLKISGRDARHMVMQKLMRESDEVCSLL